VKALRAVLSTGARHRCLCDGDFSWKEDSRRESGELGWLSRGPYMRQKGCNDIMGGK